MKNLDIKKSSILKMICYFFIPIFMVILALKILYAVYAYENPEIEQKAYFDSQVFSNTYLSKIYECKDRINYDGYYYQSFSIENDLGEKIYYELDSKSNFYYLVIDENIAYTNVKCTMQTDSIIEIQNYITKFEYYWNFNNNILEEVIIFNLESGKKEEIEEKIFTQEEFIKETGVIETNIEKLDLNNTRYSDIYRELSNKKVSLYTGVPEKLEQKDSLYFEKLLYEKVKEENRLIYVNIIITIGIITILVVYLIKSTGYKKGHDGIYLNWFDKIPLEIIIIGLCIGWFIAIFMVSEMVNLHNIIFASAILIITYINTILDCASIIKRIKSNTLIKNTIIAILYNQIKNILKVMFNHLQGTIKLGILYTIFLIGLMLCVIIFQNSGLVVIVLPIYLILVFYELLKYIQNMLKIKEALKNIYEGNVEETLVLEEFNGELKQTATYVNDIAGGFSNAMEENLKNERLKTELITNVSHDIKTPLTSIINYVDLLKKEDIKNEKVQEYIQVLDNKSQRLKKLTEDLVEASKVASGNIKLNIEKINISELTMQATAEFEERFTKRGLEVNLFIPENKIQIDADSRYMYRIYENILNNISKYALENTRVYIDITKLNKKVYIIFKNISKDKLNISAEELMQRFVRGDESRTTEGSGLGLSITKSLTEIQNGKFEMFLDGDLFKLILEFEISSEDI